MFRFYFQNQIVYCQFDHVLNYSMDQLMPYSDSWCEKIMENIRKKESLLARLLISKITQKWMNLSFHQLGFTKSTLGAPFLKTKPELFLSITHSNGFVGVSISTNPIGIDFEKVHKNNCQELQIAFDKEDWEIVKNSSLEVFKYFSLKESYSKMIGTGFTTEPASIKIDKLKNNNYVSFFEYKGEQYVISIIVDNPCLSTSIRFPKNYLYQIIK